MSDMTISCPKCGGSRYAPTSYPFHKITRIPGGVWRWYRANLSDMKKRVDSVAILIASFKAFLDAYDRDCPFTKYGQLEYHVETIGLRRSLGSAKAALNDEMFQRSLYRTLQAWGIGSRASILRQFSDFVAALQAKAEAIEEVDGLTIDQPTLDVGLVGTKLARLTQSLDIVGNKARIVPGAKALHHLLPDLVVPIDREYTQRFFECPESADEKNAALGWGAFRTGFLREKKEGAKRRKTTQKGANGVVLRLES